MLRRFLNNIRYYLSYIVAFLLMSSIISNILTWLLANITSGFKDISIVLLSFIASFIFIKIFYMPLNILE